MRYEEKFCRLTLHTFASPTRPAHRPKLAKECNLPHTPTIRVNNLNKFAYKYNLYEWHDNKSA